MELSLKNDLVATYAFYAVILVVKMALMGGWTSLVRLAKGVFANPEDVRAFTTGSKTPDKEKPIFGDQGVERIRRNHLNDLENIPSFLFVAFIYLLTNPDPAFALLLFRIYTGTRFIHMMSYQLGVQPWRALCHFVGLGITGYMGLQVVNATW